MKSTLAAAANTLIPAYLALLQRGLSVSRHPSLVTESEEEYWVAENADCRFIAEDPLMLLGLVALRETRGADWKASDEEIERFLAEFGLS